MIGGGDRSELEHELIEVQILAELTFLDRNFGGAPQGVRKGALGLDQVVPSGTGLIVQLSRHGVEDAASRQLILPSLQGAFEDRSKAGLASRLFQRGDDDDFDKALARLCENLKLELLLGAEVGEEAALRHAGRARERADGQLLEADLADELEGLVDDLIIVRPFVLSTTKHENRHSQMKSNTSVAASD
jgi:hypothetical protein